MELLSGTSFKVCLLILSLFSSSVVFGDGGSLKADDLIKFSEVGLGEFSKVYGRASYDQIYAITSAVSDDGEGATLKYYYGEPAQRRFATFFCHEHSPGELDCHEVR